MMVQDNTCVTHRVADLAFQCVRLDKTLWACLRKARHSETR